MTIAAQAADPIPASDGGPVPDDPVAVSMFSAHRVDDALHELAHATERMQAARDTEDPGLRRYHSGHIARHLHAALDNAHDLAANIREHYPEEAAELEAVKRTVGLAKAVSEAARAATSAHLLETSLHELTHADRHARQMLEGTPGAEWQFNADHCHKHLGGAVEHTSKLRQHLIDNYPAEGGWLTALQKITSGTEDQAEHARYAGRDAEPAETISGQLG